MSKSKIKKLEEENAELRRVLLSPFTITDACPFSSMPSSRNGYDETAKRRCTNPLGREACSQCRVAAEWEEIYG